MLVSLVWAVGLSILSGPVSLPPLLDEEQDLSVIREEEEGRNMAVGMLLCPV